MAWYNVIREAIAARGKRRMWPRNACIWQDAVYHPGRLPPTRMTPLTVENLTAGIYIVVGIMLLIALYHLILIAVSVRKIMRRVEDVSEHLQTVVLTPLGYVEKGFELVAGLLAAHHATKGKKKEKEPHPNHANSHMDEKKEKGKHG